jgi:fermentation-respiration switch protein FrsA (DUF1100 family)
MVTRSRTVSPGRSPGSRSASRRRRVPAAIALLLLAGAAAACVSRTAGDAELSEYRALRGTLAAAETSRVGARGRYALYRVRLRSSTGLAATGRLLRPAEGAGPWAAILLNDGRELNSRALDYLPPEFGDVVVLSLDYPREIPYEVSASDLLVRGGELREAGRRIPPLFSLGAMYLARRSDVDSARLGVAATSFAVPFAVIAAAMDERFREVALIYGAGDLPRVLAANLRLRPALLRRPVAWLATRPLAPLAPERFAARIAPRPLVMVNGSDDPQMPAEAARSLLAAARDPKAIVWLRTGHLMPDDSALIRQLVDTAMARMTVLTPAPPASRPARPGARAASP